MLWWYELLTFIKPKIRLQLSNSKLLKEKINQQNQLYSKKKMLGSQPRHMLISHYLPVQTENI